MGLLSTKPRTCDHWIDDLLVGQWDQAIESANQRSSECYGLVLVVRQLSVRSGTKLRRWKRSCGLSRLERDRPQNRFDSRAHAISSLDTVSQFLCDSFASFVGNPSPADSRSVGKRKNGEGTFQKLSWERIEMEKKEKKNAMDFFPCKKARNRPI